VFDLALAPPLHPAQAALRLGQLVRAGIAEEEVELRAHTFAARGHQLDLPRPAEGPLRVLTVGEPAPKFLALSHALTEQGADVTAAFTAYTAFDFLHDRPFDAVVLWAGKNDAEALSIATGMRRNTRLFHLPTLLYLRTTSEVQAADAYQRGLSDIASADTPPEDTARRVMALGFAYRRETAMRRALERARGSGLMDAVTGLFTRDLFALHLARLAEAARTRRRPLSVAVLRIANRPDLARARAGGWLERSIPQVGSMIGRLVRAEDTAARLAPDVFALALPASPASSATAVAQRIAAVIACTAFQTEDGQPPFTLDFDIGVAELKPGETPAQTLERAAADALSRQAG
jgi:two-component system cell cycle response regulator PopA